jgi:hypothetical protein
MEMTEFSVTLADEDEPTVATGNVVIDGVTVPFVLSVIGDAFTLGIVTAPDNPILMPVPYTCGRYEVTATEDAHVALRALALDILNARPVAVLNVYRAGFPWIVDTDDEEPDDTDTTTSRLAYGDEVEVGATIWWEPGDGMSTAVSAGWATVMRIKESAYGPLSMILDRDGEQVPGYYSPAEVVRFRIAVNPFDIDGVSAGQ